ncbi:unnamed protein product [Prunus brigantina]
MSKLAAITFNVALSLEPCATHGQPHMGKKNAQESYNIYEMLGSNAQHKDTRGKRVGMYEITAVGSKMLEGDAGIVGISRSPMNSLAAISSSSSWSELDSELEGEEPGRSVWIARPSNNELPTNLNYPISWTNRYRIESKTWINQVALREGLDSEESDARHSAHGRQKRTVPGGSGRMDQIRESCYDKRSQHERSQETLNNMTAMMQWQVNERFGKDREAAMAEFQIRMP